MHDFLARDQVPRRPADAPLFLSHLPAVHPFPPLGSLTQIGMVVELAEAGDVQGLYEDKDKRPYSLLLGLKVLAGAAKGLAYMHSMPVPIVHRDIKSGNIMVMMNEAQSLTGKVGDCGESRRVALDHTMTRMGSPLWAAPELLAGERYCEDVDTYSFGVVMYEVATRQLPYMGRIVSKGRKSERQKMAMRLMQDIAKGKERIGLDVQICKRHGVGQGFKKLFKLCTMFKARKRPSMHGVARKLHTIIEEASAKQAKRIRSRKHLPQPPKYHPRKSKIGVRNPWSEGSSLFKAFTTFASRIKEEDRAKLEELQNDVVEILGSTVVDPEIGVYNAPRLYRFLCNNEMDVSDATAQVVVNSSSRAELNMKAKRERIVSKDLSYGTLPRMAECLQYHPMNRFVCTSKDRDIIGYVNYGTKADLEGLMNAFSVEEYVDGEWVERNRTYCRTEKVWQLFHSSLSLPLSLSLSLLPLTPQQCCSLYTPSTVILFNAELGRIFQDAIGAVEARNILQLMFFDCHGATIGKVLGFMEYMQSAASAMARVIPVAKGSTSYLINFPGYAKMVLDML